MTGTQVPSWAQSPNKITEKQRSYIESLLESKDLSGIDQARIDGLWKQLRISYDHEEIGITKPKASEIIEWLKARPWKPREQQAAQQPLLPIEVPAGRYAVENNEGELRFYQVWRPKDNGHIFRVYVLHGPDESALHNNAAVGVLRKIQDFGIREAAIRYGNEIGACSNCGRRLTNRISRELGIGPICGGRMFGGEFKDEVRSARERIKERGEDPDEELEE
jgi:hypothetical protein